MDRNHKIITIEVKYDLRVVHRDVYGDAVSQHTERATQTVKVIATCPEIAVAHLLQENPFRFPNGVATVLQTDKIFAVIETHTF